MDLKKRGNRRGTEDGEEGGERVIPSSNLDSKSMCGVIPCPGS